MIEYIGKLKKQQSLKNVKIQLIGSLFTILFLFLAGIFLILSKPFLTAFSIIILLFLIAVFNVVIPKYFDQNRKNLLKIQPFFNFDENNGVTHGGLTIKWEKVSKIAIIGEGDDGIERNEFSSNLSNLSGNTVIILVEFASDDEKKDFKDFNSPLLSCEEDFALLSVDLSSVEYPVDLVEKISAIAVDKDVEIMYTDNDIDAEKFLEKD